MSIIQFFIIHFKNTISESFQLLIIKAEKYRRTPDPVAFQEKYAKHQVYSPPVFPNVSQLIVFMSVALLGRSEVFA